MINIIFVLTILIISLIFAISYFNAIKKIKDLQRSIDDMEAKQAIADHEVHLFNVLMDNIPDTIYFKDLDSKFTKINKAQAKVIGAPTPEFAIGKDDFAFFPEEHAKMAYEDEQEFIRNGEPLVGKIEHIGEVGFEWVSATKVPFKDNNGKIVGLVGISRNISKQKIAEEKIIAAVEEVAGAMNEIASSSAQVAANIENSTKYSEEVRSIAESGQELKSSVIENVNHTNDSLNKITSAIDKLSNDSYEIGRLVELISDIADRTNVISLNAAIEAASSGEDGSGFTQIANEVRVLSDKSADLANQIRILSSNNNTNTDQAINLVTEGSKYSSDSVRNIEKLGQSLNKIFDATEHVKQMLTEIMVATRQQADTTAEVEKQLHEISTASKVSDK